MKPQGTSKLGPPHGGEAAVKALQRGTEHTGLAHDAELSVRDELHNDGRYALVVRNATRLQAAADCYWQAFAKAAQDGELEALDRYVKRYGWLASCALRAWGQVRSERPDPAALDYATEIERLANDEKADD